MLGLLFWSLRWRRHQVRAGRAIRVHSEQSNAMAVPAGADQEVCQDWTQRTLSKEEGVRQHVVAACHEQGAARHIMTS